MGKLKQGHLKKLSNLDIELLLKPANVSMFEQVIKKQLKV
jgi:hypothetical protein